MQHWAQSGGVGSQQVIASVTTGELAVVTTVLLGLGSTVLGTPPGINALVARVDLAALAALACALPVSSISIDAVVTATGSAEAPAPESLRATLGLPLHSPAGAGVTVAVIDSGIAASADFGNRIVAFFDVTRGALPTSPSDAYGHGTHVAGLIAGAGGLAAGGLYQGLGPHVRLVGMKVLDANGAGRTSDVIRAVELTTLLRPILGVQIINLSLGHPTRNRAHTCSCR
jgi:serine protease AprX